MLLANVKRPLGYFWASQVALVVKNPPANAGDIRDRGSIPRSGRFPWRRAGQLTLVLLPGESHGQRSVVGYSPQATCHRVGHDSSNPACMQAGRLLLYQRRGREIPQKFLPWNSFFSLFLSFRFLWISLKIFNHLFQTMNSLPFLSIFPAYWKTLINLGWFFAFIHLSEFMGGDPETLICLFFVCLFCFVSSTVYLQEEQKTD